MRGPHRLTRRHFVRLGGWGLSALAASTLGKCATAQDADVVQFKPELTRPPEFAAFWKQQLGALRDRGPVEYRLTPGPFSTKAQVWDIKYPSVDDRTEVWGWYAVPAGTAEGKKVQQYLTNE